MRQNFDQEEHDNVVHECFSKLWRYSADLMFIMAVEPDGEFTLYDNNPASRAVMGMDADQPIHRYNIRETWDEEIVEGLYETYRQAIDARKPVSFEQFATVDDIPIFVDTLFVPIFDNDDNPIFVCGVARDISKIKEAEQMALDANIKLQEYSQALESINSELDEKVKARTQELETITHDLEAALEAKSSFVSRISHEIRTPINAMLGLSNLLKKSRLDEVQQDYVNKILDSGSILIGLVNDILDFSKINADKLEPESVVFNPEIIMKQALNLSGFKATEKQIELACFIDPMMPRKLQGDPLRIQQIVINLLSNAVKFTHKGAVTLNVEFRPRGTDKGTLEYSVTDTGIGLSMEQQAHLFRSFMQADNSITRRYGGSGLGLSICKKLAELMGGSISVESEVNQGSCFSVRIPVEVAEAESLINDVVLEKNSRILLIDPSAYSASSNVKMLSSVGFEVDHVPFSGQGLARAREAFSLGQPFDRIVVDWDSVRGEHAESTLKILKQYQKSNKLIVMADGLKSVADQGCDGLFNCIEKPITPAAIFPQLGHVTLFQPSLNIQPPMKELLAGHRVLLVDDNPINLQVALGYLDDYGLRVDTATNGEEAIEKVRLQDYDLVLMDIQMPKLDGLSATRQIRASHHTKIPVIALTAHVAEATVQECLDSGMCGHLSKPLDEYQLQQTLLTHLDIDFANNRVSESGNYTEELIEELKQADVLDMDSALARLNQREPLYLSLVQSFYFRYRDNPLVCAVQDLDVSVLKDELHSLKSNAAYIGAPWLARLASDLEQNIERSGYEKQAEALSSMLNTVIQQLAPIYQKPKWEDKSPFSDPLFEQELTTLLNQLAKSDFAAEKTLRTILAQTDQSGEVRELLEIVEQYLEEIEFESAHIIVKQMLS